MVDFEFPYLRSMTKPFNSVKPNSSLHNMKVSYFITFAILKVCKYYHGYIAYANAKNCVT